MNNVCIHAAECGLFSENVCTVREIAEKNCGGPILMATTGDCKICGKENVKVHNVNQYVKACQKCYDYLIIPRRSGRV